VVRGHRELISQALANLVDNAIKYAAPAPQLVAACAAELPDEPPPDITVTAGVEGDRVVLTVADRGPGIPADQRGHAVERFVRLEQSRSQPGSGLGLSLASAIAHLHHGELRLEDNAPGLRAVILLPRAGPQPSG
jgi:signal transduction histidine kinase